ncbi:MAG: hypothetical protein ACK5QC_17095 [Bacteroidota bacterium]
MNIPPLLEKLLLSNEAVFKNASLGLSGQNMVFVPAGKTAVILEVSIEPFCNAITTGAMAIFEKGSNGNTESVWSAFIRRVHYQLQIINDKYQTYINLNDSLSASVVPFMGNGGIPTSGIYGTLSFSGKREDLFIYTDRSLYFNLIYPYKIQEEGPDTPGFSPTYDTPANGFLPKIQNIPPSPTTFYKNNFQDYVVYYDVISTGTDNYYPVNHQSSALYPENPQMEYLRFFNGVNETTVQIPVASKSELLFHDLFSIPFINVKYALLNKRPDDYGITMPTKS